MSTNKTYHPFSITIYMAEGDPDGIRIVKQANWDGVGVICPRGRYNEAAAKRPEFTRSGVYILIGNEGDAVRIYVGETDTLGARLSQHAGKVFWTQVVIFTKQSEANPLNKAGARYLEARLLEIARRNKRCEVDNQNEPGLPSLSEEDAATMEGYLHKMLPLLSVIGVRAFEDVPPPGRGRVIYYYGDARKKEWKASGYETNNGFVVQKDSFARMKTVDSMLKSTKIQREKAIADQIMVEEKDGYRFAVDYEFNSPSQAASVVSGSNVNGWDAWKDKKDKGGKTLKDNQPPA